MIGGLKTKLKIIDFALLFALLACLCLLMSMTCTFAADSDGMLDNQSADIDSIPLDDGQEALCCFSGVSNGIYSTSNYENSNDTSDVIIEKTDDASNLNSDKTDDAFNTDIDKTPEKINATKINPCTVNKNSNPTNSSIFADSSPQSIKQTFSDCKNEHYKYDLDDSNIDSSKKTAENKVNDHIINYSYDFNTINQINISNNAHIKNIQYPIYINRDWDNNEKLYRKDFDSTILKLNFNQVFKEISLDDNYAPNYQLSDDPIQENYLGFDELIIEDNDCLPSNYHILDQLIQIDYGNNITTIHRLENSLSSNNYTFTGLNYETLLSPIILSFNFKGGFLFNYIDSCYPNVNIININKNGVKIHGVYAEGNTLTTVNNSLGKCIYTTPKFLNKESVVVENTVKSLTFNNNIKDCQSNWNANKTITPTNIYIFNNNLTKNINPVFIKNVFNIKNCIFKGFHKWQIIKIHSIYNHVKFCNKYAVVVEHINYSLINKGGNKADDATYR